MVWWGLWIYGVWDWYKTELLSVLGFGGISWVGCVFGFWIFGGLGLVCDCSGLEFGFSSVLILFNGLDVLLGLVRVRWLVVVRCVSGNLGSGGDF